MKNQESRISTIVYEKHFYHFCTMKNIKVLVLEDNKPRRDLLKLLIDSADTMQCVGVLEDGRDIVAHIGHLRPDVILIDIDMPHVNGIEALKLIKQNFSHLKILMQTVFEDESKIFEAIMEGADGYILKKTSPDSMLEAVVDVYNGGSPMTPVVARQVINLFKNKHEYVSKVDFSLSAREYEVLSFLV